MLSTIKLAALYVSCAVRAALCQQTWTQVLSGQVLGPLYILQDGANTSQLVAGHSVDPFVQDLESVPAAVLVAKGEQVLQAATDTYHFVLRHTFRV